jgi:Lamin Tail Domain
MSRFKRAGRLLAAGVVAVLAPAMVVLPATTAGAATGVVISEVAPWASGSSPYMADWFELTNTSASAITVTGWKMDDNSNSFGSAVPMIGVTSIPAGGSAIFVEGTASTATAFTAAWFGASPPSGLLVGSYTGSGVGLSTSGDAVNVYDSSGTLMANVTFGASDATSPFQSFDNAAGATGAISTLSATGVNGAFVASADPAEIGSPGTIANSASVPEVPYLVLLPASAGVAFGAFLVLKRRRPAAV